MPADRKSVFISIGHTYRDEYAKLLDHLIEILTQNNLRPRVIDKTDPSIARPIDNIISVMSECSGAVIVAFERKFFARGKEKRKSSGEYDLQNISMTTPWSQIEIALAHQRDLPILVLMEDGVHKEGLIDFGFDWYVQHFSQGEDPLGRPDVQRRIAEWAKSIHNTMPGPATTAKIDDGTTLFQIAGLLSVKTALQITALFLAVFTAGLTLGSQFPGLHQKAAESGK